MRRHLPLVLAVAAAGVVPATAGAASRACAAPGFQLGAAGGTVRVLWRGPQREGVLVCDTRTGVTRTVDGRRSRRGGDEIPVGVWGIAGRWALVEVASQQARRRYPVMVDTRTGRSRSLRVDNRSAVSAAVPLADGRAVYQSDTGPLGPTQRRPVLVSEPDGAETTLAEDAREGTLAVDRSDTERTVVFWRTTDGATAASDLPGSPATAAPTQPFVGAVAGRRCATPRGFGLVAASGRVRVYERRGTSEGIVVCDTGTGRRTRVRGLFLERVLDTTGVRVLLETRGRSNPDTAYRVVDALRGTSRELTDGPARGGASTAYVSGGGALLDYAGGVFTPKITVSVLLYDARGKRRTLAEGTDGALAIARPADAKAIGYWRPATP